MKSNYTKKIYGDFFNLYDWNFYATLTTSYPLSIKSSRRAVERFLKILNTNYQSNNHIFYASEPFDLIDGNHIHCLIQLENNKFSSISQAKKAIKESWQSATGRNENISRHLTQVNKFNRKLGGSWYMAKYLQHKNSDYDFLPHDSTIKPRLFNE